MSKTPRFAIYPSAHSHATAEQFRLIATERGCEAMEGDNCPNPDFAVALGGDGTFLDVASRVADKQIPIIGINTGRLGFLASYAPDNLNQLIDDIITGNYTLHSHSLLHLTSPDTQLLGTPYALNEIAILKHDISAMITIHTAINGECLTTYQADGLLITTPTGSTAYNLSVGGPVIAPSTHAICLTPVAPHSLTLRPIVLDDTAEISLQVESRSSSFLISLDGRSQSYPHGIRLTIRKAPHSVHVVTPKNHSFLSTLREKMMWGADCRE